jgi:hypothetical protein
MEMTIHLLFEHGAAFAHLPLEDSRAFWESRLLARLSGDWRMMDDDAEGAPARLAAHGQYASDLGNLMRGICENPGRAVRLVDGVEAVPFLPPRQAIDWIRRASAEYRVVSIDPLSLIDWQHDGEKENDAQKRFMAHVLAIAAKANNTVTLVCHTIKRPGRSASLALTQEDVQGSKMFTNVAHTVLLLDAHEKRESGIVGSYPQLHSRTLVIGKARNGSGAHSQIAMEFHGPHLEELGLIAPKTKKERANG